MSDIISLEQILTRISESDFEILLGNKTIKMLNLMNENELYTKDLKKITLELFGLNFFLNNKLAKKMILNSLKIEEAERLAEILNVSFTNRVELYENLINKSIPSNSLIEQKLFEFFNVKIENAEETLSYSEVVNSNVTPNYPLFKHQRRAAKKINSLLNKFPNRVLLHMPTGAGKTRTAMNIITDYLRENEDSLVIWLATTEELCQQAYEEFQKAWLSLGNREIQLYKLWGNLSSLDEINNKDGLIVAGLPKINSIINSRNGVRKFMDFATELDFIVMDEAHQSIAPTYKFIIDTIFNIYTPNTKRLLGLSATPGRTWNDIEEDQKLSDFFANNKVTLEVEGFKNPVEFLISEGYLAKVEYKNINYDDKSNDVNYSLEKYTDIPSSILKVLGEDEVRNIQIILHCEELTTRHNRIIIFAPSVESSNLIAFALRHKGHDASSLTGNTDSNLRKIIIEKFKNKDTATKILVNYGILTTGFDAPQTSAAIIARPTLSLVLYSQMVGRAIRGVKAGGNKKAEILTVVDKSLPGFNSVADAFFNWEDVWNR